VLELNKQSKKDRMDIKEGEDMIFHEYLTKKEYAKI
jgi:hypothetical protein